MKKMKFAFICLAMISVLIMVGCNPEPRPEDTRSDKAFLTSVSVAIGAVTPLAAPVVPTPITSAQWDAANLGLGAYPPSDIVFTDISALPEMPAQVSLVVTAQVSKGAKIRYAFNANINSKPSTFSPSNTLTVTRDRPFYIEVTAENGKVVNYYRFRSIYRSPDNGVISIKINNVDVSFEPAGAAWNTAEEGTITKPTRFLEDVTVVVEKSNPAATVKYAKVTGSGAPTEWNTTGLFPAGFVDGDYLYIEVTADSGAKAYYKFAIEQEKAAIATLSSVFKINNAVATFGTPATTWEAITTAGAATIATAQTSFETEVEATATDDYATVEFAVVGSGGTPEFSTTTTIIVRNGDFLYIKVTAENGTTVQYYKTVITLQDWTPTEIFGLRVGGITFGAQWTSGTAQPMWRIGTAAGTAVQAFGANPTIVGWVVLSEEECTNVAVSVKARDSTAAARVAYLTVPNTTGTTLAAAVTTTFSGLDNGNTIPARSYTGKEYLQVQYTPTSGTTTYYNFYIRRRVDIPYIAAAAVTVTQTTGMAATIIEEAAWENAPLVYLERAYMPDSASFSAVTDYVQTDRSTHPTVKLLWSDDGLYVLAKIKDATPSYPPTVSSSAHLGDNLEVFIAETYTIQTSGNWTAQSGAQYRVARDGYISAESTGQVTRMVNSDATGYVVKAKIAWRSTPTTVSGWTDKMIGFDLQEAYSRSSATRDACVVWSNFLSGMYTQFANTGLAYLKR